MNKISEFMLITYMYHIFIIHSQDLFQRMINEPSKETAEKHKMM